MYLLSLLHQFAHTCYHVFPDSRTVPLSTCLKPITMSISASGPSIPRNHAEADIKQEKFGLLDKETFDWVGQKQCTANAFLTQTSFATEADVAMFVRLFINDLISALSLDVMLVSELQVYSVRPDLWVVSKTDGTPIGAIEVKKPVPYGKQEEKEEKEDIFNNKLVHGELFDQMKQIQQFYGYKFSLGILTDGNRWQVCWYGKDENMSRLVTDVENRKDKDSTGMPKTPLVCCRTMPYFLHKLLDLILNNFFPLTAWWRCWCRYRHMQTSTWRNTKQ